MTKEEKIKEAWGDNYPPKGTDNNGWSKDDVDYGTFDVKLFDYIPYMKSALIRPKSLQGIENNNGWIKIESEEDLPKEDTSVHIVFTNYKGKVGEYMTFGDWINKDKCFYSGGMRIHTATHYQPIEKPKPPLY